MIKLVISDLDGTFLNSQGEFNRERFGKVKELMKSKGVIFTACTGKQGERVEELFGAEYAKDIWILGDSATRIKYNGEYVYESLLGNEVGLEIITKLEEIEDDHTVIACTPTTAFIKDTTPEASIKRVRGSYTNVEILSDYQTIAEDFVKITVYDPKLRCYESVKHLDPFNAAAFIVASEAAWIDIANKGVHKGSTVQKLQEILNISYEETMVFGDGYNDRELLASGKYSFAMRNAFEELKEIANYITRSNDEEGVLLAVEEFLALQANIN
ncbi:HAD family hydrolase [Lacticigenium naphthae]|uniref:HAD family hydrolase n=1 Tax=Lacticigenium naphthae TaxID=515351 RepID=UPI000419AF60|nr:HAD family hydrolase [Lacticigenium naphthae]